MLNLTPLFFQKEAIAGTKKAGKKTPPKKIRGGGKSWDRKPMSPQTFFLVGGKKKKTIQLEPWEKKQKKKKAKGNF